MLSEDTSSTDVAKTLKGTKKTGTTIVGLVYNDGVILAADTRATAGHLVMDKDILKVHRLTPAIFCCGAGTAADNDHVCELISSQLRLMELNMRRTPRVETACIKFKRHLFPYHGQIGAYIILGGCDFTGAHLYNISAYGSVDKNNFTTMGSGSYAAMSIFETRYKPGLNEQEASQLAIDAVTSGIMNDEGSGFFVDYVIIRKQKEPPYGLAEFHRHVVKPSPRPDKIPGLLSVKKKETEIMKEIVLDFKTQREEVTIDKPFNTPMQSFGDLQ